MTGCEDTPESGSGRERWILYLGNGLVAEPISSGLRLTSADVYMVGFFRVMYYNDHRCSLSIGLEDKVLWQVL